MLDAPLSLRVELDRDGHPPSFEASEPLRGTIYIEADEEVEGTLRLHREWRVESQAGPYSDDGSDHVVCEQTWYPGETYEHPFEWELPPGPYDYEGRYLQIGWCFSASVDLALGEVNSLEHPFELVPGEAEGYRGGGLNAEQLQSQRPEDASRISWGMTLSGAAVALGCIFGVAWYVVVHPFHPMYLAPLIFAGLGGLMTYLGLQNLIAERMLGDVDVALEPPEVAPGETLTCRVRLNPSTTVELDRVHVHLRGYERVRGNEDSPGDESVSHIHELHSAECVPDHSQSASLGPNDATVYEAHLPIPESTGYSFEAPYREVTWKLEVTIEQSGWNANWSHTAPLLVRPQPAETSPC